MTAKTVLSPPSKRRFTKSLFIGGLMVVLLAGGGVYAYVNAHHDKAKPAPPAAASKKQPAVKASAAATPPAPTYTAGAPCQAAQLSFAYAKPDGSRGLGHDGSFYSFTNTSTVPCTVNGYPTIKLYDASNNLLPITTGNGGTWAQEDPGPTAATLNPGAQLYFALGWGHGQVAGTTCPDAAAVEATAPGTSTPLRDSTKVVDFICGTVAVTAIAPLAAFKDVP